MIRISVVTTSLNHARFLPETLNSVADQSAPAWEHLVLDGASTDGTLRLLEACSGARWRHLRWLSEPDGGQTQAMNKGLRMACGDVIGWLNSDDRYRPGALAAVREHFERNPDTDVLYGDYTFMNEQGVHVRNRREIDFNPLVLFYHRVPHIPTTSTFFRRRIFDEGNWLNEDLQYAMDHEFYVRLARKGYTFRHTPQLLADFRLHPQSKTCSMAQRQIAEARWAMHSHSPAAERFGTSRWAGMYFAGLRVSAGASRYAEKLMRGCYLPDALTTRLRLFEEGGRTPCV